MKISLKPIHQQVVVIVGASSGIGRETALEFARRGAKLMIASRNRQGMETLAEEIRQEGGKVILTEADVTDWQQVQSIAEQTVNVYGRIDTWVQLAAVTVFSLFDQMRPEEFRQVVEVNLIGEAYGAMAALPYLKRTGQGALILVSSPEERIPLPLQSAYTASKHGLKGLIDTLRIELKHTNTPISVTDIVPGSVDTPFFEHARSRLGVKPKPVPPVYDPSVVAQTILYAAEHPVDRLDAGETGLPAMAAQRITPRFTRKILKSIGFGAQRSQEPDRRGDNLFSPMQNTSQVHGVSDRKALTFSPVTWIQTHPAVSRAVVGGIIGGTLGVVALQVTRLSIKSRRKWYERPLKWVSNLGHKKLF